MNKKTPVISACRRALPLLFFSLVLLYDEFLLRLFAGPGTFRSPQYAILTAVSAGLFCTLITSFGKSFLRSLMRSILLLLSAVWFIIQTLLNRVYAMYFPAESIRTGAGGVASQYSGMLFRTILLDIPVILLYLLPLIAYAAVSLYLRKNHRYESVPASLPVRTSVLRSGSLLLSACLLQFAAVSAEAGGKDADVYASAYTFDNATRTFGLLSSTRLDLKYLLWGSSEAAAFDLSSDFSASDLTVQTADLSEPSQPDDSGSPQTAGQEYPETAQNETAMAEPAAESETETYSETESETMTASETEAEAVTASETEAEAVTASETEAEAVAASETEKGAESASEAAAPEETPVTVSSEMASDEISPSLSAMQEETLVSPAAETAVSSESETEAAPFRPDRIHVKKTSSGKPLVLKGGKPAGPAGSPLIITCNGTVLSQNPSADPDPAAAAAGSNYGISENTEENEIAEKPDEAELSEAAEEADDDTEVDEGSVTIENDADISSAEESEAEIPENTPIVYEPNIMDTDFEKLAVESSDPARAISEYVTTLTPSLKNAYTGLFKGKNLILICAEAYNDSFVSRELTPTLWRMTHEGFYFSDFYQPAWGGSTSTGEFSMLFGLAPQNSSNTILQTQNSNNYFTMGNQLQRLGYSSWAFHNGTNTYYGRDKTHKNLGYDEWIAMGSGLEELSGGKYLNDEEMFDVTMDLYLDRQPFSVYYMSVSGHAPYSNPGDSKVVSHIEKVKKVLGDHYDDYSQNTINYICYQMVLDDALHLMIRRLEKAGIAEDTVIAMTGDHYPYGLRGAEWGNSIDNIENLYGHEAQTPWGLDKTGCVIWSECLEKSCKDMAVEIDTPAYSLDMLPTLSNLFGLEYDSRLLIGRDVFSGQMPLVLWNNGSWITERGRYNARTGAYEPAESYRNEEVPASPAEAAAENARLHPELFPEEKKSEPLIIRLNGVRPDPEDGPDGASSGGSRNGLSDRDTQMPRDAAADQEFSGPENEDEYKEWIRTVVKNKLAFSKQVIDNNYYETLFGKDEEADG